MHTEDFRKHHLDCDLPEDLDSLDDDSVRTIKSPGPETVDELRDRLERMKLMMAEKNALMDGKQKKKKAGSEVIDGNFLSIMFAVTLFVIIAVSVYAFYNLFWAIWKRNARYHEEL